VIFTRAALREIHRISGGIPRVINILCDRSMLGAYTQELHLVPASLVRRAGAEVFGHEFMPQWMPAAAASLAAAVLIGSALLLWHYAPFHWPAFVHAAAQPAAATTPASAAAPATAPGPVMPAASAPGTAATPGAQAATAPAPSLASLLTDYRTSTDSDTAFMQLFGLWNAEYVPGKIDGCSQALTQGLRCLNQRGSFAQLRLLNRPAILMLSDDAGTAYQVVLRSLHEDTAQLQIGTQTTTVGVAELARYWFGDFVLLWRPGTRDVRDLSQGMHGALVRHLRDELVRWRGPEGSLASGDTYDSDLMQAVEQFQRASRLTVDGVAGIETQVALDAALAAPDSPLLETRAATTASRGS
jgi:general secretion pathway protein A